jgi:hypothetical protein
MPEKIFRLDSVDMDIASKGRCDRENRKTGKRNTFD